VEVTGIVLVGGTSARFGSPKALARLGDETLAERAWRILGACCDHRLAVGKATDALDLPFDVVDDGTDVRAPLAGLVAGLRAAPTELCLVLPVDAVTITPATLELLVAAAADRTAAIPQTGPLPGCYRRSSLPILERRLGAGELRLRDAATELDAAVVELPNTVLANANVPADLPAWSTARVDVTRLTGGTEADVVAVEEPLEIRIGAEPIAVTMRTPGDDEDLAIGFALGEGLEPVDASPTADFAANTIELRVRHFDPDRLKRHFYTSSSCGVCGKGALDAVAVSAPPVLSDLQVDGELLAALPDRLREAQVVFLSTGGLHAAGLFEEEGPLLCVREDVGRHNALDKVVGWAFRAGLVPLARSLLCVSGRLSFELVQKTALAGCPVLVGVGAPSSLAVELAEAQGVTLCGFARGGSLNVYAHRGRVRLPSQASAASRSTRAR
jgi:FdhD protein